MKRLPQALRVAGIYLGASLVWIVASDTVAARLAPSPDALLFLSTTKGWAFVVVTTALLYVALERDRRSVAAEARARAEAEQRSRRVSNLYQVLGETGEAVLGLARGRDILPEACRIAVDIAGLRMAWVGMVDADTGTIAAVASAGHVDGFFEQHVVSVADVPSGRGPTGFAIREGHTVTCNDIAADPLAAGWRALAIPRGYRSAASAPLWRDGQVVGSFVAYASEPDYFTPDIVEVFERIAGSVSFGLDFQRREEERNEADARLEAYRAELEDRVAERTAELRVLAERLADADRAKSRFLANMSHELRTPLNSIIGFTGVLLQGMAGDLTGEQRMQLDMVSRSGKYLLGLVNDVLDLSRIEAGRVSVEPVEFDLVTLAADCVETLRPLAVEKSLELKVGLPDCPMMAFTDRAKVKQITLNLLANAVKFTLTGSVSLNLRTVGRDRFAVSVEDTGPGISPEELSSVLEEFYQVERPEEGDKSPGSGLGLPITKRLAEMIGGTLLVRSTLGEGSVFEVVAPLQLSADARS